MLSLLSLGALLLSTAGLVDSVAIPSKDPFYTPPANYASSKPGTVFGARSVASGYTGVTATQILYRTNDALNNPAATVATYLKQANSSSSKLIVFNIYEDAANSTCSPSYLFSSGDPTANFGPESGSDLKDTLNLGVTVVVPDYEESKSAFAAGHLEGRAVLDALRAVIGYAPAGMSARTVVGGYGYSGGAIATGWAAALQPSYAPELSVKGFAFGGTPANLTSTLVNVDGGLYAGFAVAGIAGLIQAYPTAYTRYTQIATTAGFQAINQSLIQCAVSDLFSFAFKSVLSAQFQSLGAGFLKDPVILSVLAQNILGVNTAEVPRAPIFMYHSITDEVIPFFSAQATYNSWCAAGASITFLTEDGGAGHLGTGTSLEPEAIAWLGQRFSGVAAPTGCSNSTIKSGGLGLRRRDEFGIYTGKRIVT